MLALCLLTLCLLTAPLLRPTAAAAQKGRAPVERVRLLASQPHDSTAFTQGFFLRHGVYYESTGLYGQSSVRRVDPATGRVLARRDLPEQLFGEGLALCAGAEGERLVQLTWREGVILTYDAATLRSLESRPLRGQGWGLACNGGEAAVSDGTATLRFLDARTLIETGRTLRVHDGARPVVRINELEWVNGWLVANIWQEDLLAVIRPADGQVALWLDLAPLRRELAKSVKDARDPGNPETANGVGFDPAGDGGRGALLLTGKRWDRVFTAALPKLLRRPPEAAQKRVR